jgi:hypothetical protein
MKYTLALGLCFLFLCPISQAQEIGISLDATNEKRISAYLKTWENKPIEQVEKSVLIMIVQFQYQRRKEEVRLKYAWANSQLAVAEDQLLAARLDPNTVESAKYLQPIFTHYLESQQRLESENLYLQRRISSIKAGYITVEELKNAKTWLIGYIAQIKLLICNNDQCKTMWKKYVKDQSTLEFCLNLSPILMGAPTLPTLTMVTVSAIIFYVLKEYEPLSKWCNWKD